MDSVKSGFFKVKSEGFDKLYFIVAPANLLENTEQ